MNDSEMIRNPDLWPFWPRLPVKRPRLGQLVNECAVILDNTDDFGLLKEPVRLYHGNLFDENLYRQRYTDFETIDALLADGWIVD